MMVVFLLVCMSIIGVYRRYTVIGGIGSHFRHYVSPRFYFTFWDRKLQKEYNYLPDFCEQHFPYFRRLNEREKKEFVHRVSRIHRHKIIFAEEGFTIHRYQEILVCASVAQITFGLKSRYWLPSYTHIRLHPNTFYSKLIEHAVNGLTFQKEVIHLSWNHFYQGHTDQEDGRNLGLHELAHALYFDFEHNLSRNRFHDYFVKAKKLIHEGHTAHPFFRSYAFTNQHEFWAVSIELFFEKPEAFHTEYPYLYKALSRVLQQDPLRKNHIKTSN